MNLSKKLTYHLFVFFALLLIVQDSYAQYAVGARISGSGNNEYFGSTLNTADLTGNGHKDLIIGASRATISGQEQSGRIYFIQGPFAGDSTLTADNIIIQGQRANGRVGEVVSMADFNGNGTLDLAVTSRNFTNDGRGAIGIFFGPFETGNTRNFQNADVLIVSEELTNSFGISIAAVPGLHAGSTKNGLLIGDRDDSSLDSFAGVAYLFKNLTTASQFTTSQADVTFYGQQAGAFFATSVAAADINGDGVTDLIIGAPSAHSQVGATYIYFGPLTESSYNDEDAQTKILGRIPASGGSRWGNRVFTFGDANKNGFNDLSITADLDDNGRLAYFPGREVWPDTIRVSTIPNSSHAHTIFSRSGSNSSTGFSADFSGDYNISGSVNPVLGAPRTSTNTGAVTVYNLNGSVQRNIVINTLRQDSRFGTAIVNVGPTIPKNVDFEVDDFAVSAPGANAPFNNISNGGVIFVYGGVITEPNTNMTIQPGLNREIGDTITVRTSYTQGSRPIIEEFLMVRVYESGDLISQDTIFVDPVSGGSAEYKFVYHADYRVNFSYQVFDDLGFRATSGANVLYAMMPGAFDLITDFGDEVLEIRGQPSQQIEFLNQASADTNGRNLNYQLLFSFDPNAFQPGSTKFTTIQSSASTSKILSYEAFNEYVRQEYNLNQQGILYWNVRVTNGVLSRMASNGPGQINFMRMGLDPYFEITTNDRVLVIDGWPEDSFSFRWTALHTEDPNAFVQYNFVLSDKPNDFSSPLFRKQSPDSGTERSISLTYQELEGFLESNNLLNSAKEDTAFLHYSVEAIVNSNENDKWYPTNQSKKASIKYVQIIGESSTDTHEKIPETLILHQNFPNPFNPVTTIKFGLPENMPVHLEIFNVLGQRMYHWQSSGNLSAGYHQHTIDASRWSSGTYIYRIRSGVTVRSSQMLLVK